MLHPPSSEAKPTVVIALAPCNQLPHKRLSILVDQNQYDRHLLKYAKFHRAKSGAITVRKAGWRRSRMLEDLLQVVPRESSTNTFDFRPVETSVPPRSPEPCPPTTSDF